MGFVPFTAYEVLHQHAEAGEGSQWGKSSLAAKLPTKCKPRLGGIPWF